MKLRDGRSIVAIDPTTRGLAFVFFENGEVLDWGERLRTPGRYDELGIVDRLIDGCAADVLVLEDPDAPHSRRRPRIRALLRAIVKHARRRGIAVIPIAREDVRQAWSARGVNKEAVAAAIAARFPELTWIVPAQRKPGHTEDPRVNIFDAASLALYACEPTRVVP
jgi:hypothetical protein